MTEVKLLRKKQLDRPVVLSIAGSDSGGGAGVQADLRTLWNLGVHGACAITCVTAQNTVGVQRIVTLAPRMVAAQIGSVLADMGCRAAKTGMLGTSPIVHAVARAVRRWKIPNLVVDPVMVSTSGRRLLRPTAVAALRDRLMPLAVLVTPNLSEAAVLSGRPVSTRADMEDAARAIFDHTGAPVLVKGGHLKGRALDLLFDGSGVSRFSAGRIRARHTHGSGCTLAAAIASYLALGYSLIDAIGAAKEYVGKALQNGYSIGRGPGPVGDGSR